MVRDEGSEIQTVIHSSDIYSPEKRSNIMSRVRSKNTIPELIVRSGLHMLGYRFRLYRKNLPGSPDLVLKKYHTAIFVHGCFWHHHTVCKGERIPKQNAAKWRDKFTANTERDARVRAQLADLGWHVVIVWECAINKTDYRWLEELSNALQDCYRATNGPLIHEISKKGNSDIPRKSAT